MKINTEINQISKSTTESAQSDVKTNQQANKIEDKKIQEVKETVNTSPTTASQPIDKVEMSSSAMKIKSEGAKMQQAQEKLVAEQTAQATLTTLEEQSSKLKELASKHLSANDEDKKIIETEAKELLKVMKETTKQSTANDEVNIPKDVEQADMKEVLKPEHIEKNISKPLADAKEQVDKNLEQISSTLVASQAGSMTQADAQVTAQKVKEGLKEVDAKKLNAELDARRFNVSHLLK